MEQLASADRFGRRAGVMPQQIMSPPDFPVATLLLGKLEPSTLAHNSRRQNHPPFWIQESGI